MHDADDRERRELIDGLRLLGEIDATQTALFQHAAARSYGLSVTDMKALSILLREGPRTAGELMEQLGVTSGAVTGIVDRLQRAGVARREPDPADRRRVIVAVDDDGLRSRENVYLGIGAAFDRLYASYTNEELRFLTRHLQAAVELTRAETTALRER